MEDLAWYGLYQGCLIDVATLNLSDDLVQLSLHLWLFHLLAIFFCCRRITQIALRSGGPPGEGGSFSSAPS